MSNEQQQPQMKHLYLSRLSSVKYIFVNGKEAAFINGRYLTDVPEEIQQLDAEVKQGHPHIYVDPNHKEVDAATEDPLEAIKRKAVADYIAQQRAVNPENDAGTSDQTFKIRGVSGNAPGATAPLQGKPVGNVANQQLIGANKLNTAQVQNKESEPASPILSTAQQDDKK